MGTVGNRKTGHVHLWPQERRRPRSARVQRWLRNIRKRRPLRQAETFLGERTGAPPLHGGRQPESEKGHEGPLKAK